MLRLLLTTLALARPQLSAAASAESSEAGGGDGDRGPSYAFRPVGHETYPGPVGFPAAQWPHYGNGGYTATAAGESKDDLQRQINNLYNTVHWLRPAPMAQPPMILLTLAQSTMAQPVMIQQPMVQPAMTEPVETEQDQSSTHHLTKRQLKRETKPNVDECYKGKKKKTTNLATRTKTV